MNDAIRYTLAGLFLLTIPVANWMVGHVGTCIPDGPCVVPVLPGIMAPSAVLIIGVALVLRDAVQHELGVRWTVGLIVAGALASAFVAPPMLWIASALAFLLSELADTLVYTPLRERSAALAVALSGVAGAVVDSLLFLFIAFGSIAYAPGQIIGKLFASLLVAMALAVYRRA